MRCEKIRQLLPLLAGSELPESQIPKVQSHLNRCSRCREEYEKYAFLVDETRKWLAEEKIDWEEKEWQQTVQSAVSSDLPKRTSLTPWPFPRAWAYAFMAGVMLLLTTLVVRPPFVKQLGLTPRYVDVIGMEERETQGKWGKQDVVSMTMVSQESGLKIVWFLNKNFNLEENE
jgi:hypothetical protein